VEWDIEHECFISPNDPSTYRAANSLTLLNVFSQNIEAITCKSSLLKRKHSPMPSICSTQASPDSSGIPKGDLAYRMWLMELDAAFNIKSRWSKLPNRSVQLLGRKACCSHSKEEVRPWNLARQIGLIRVVEQSLEDFEGTVFQSEDRLLVINCLYWSGFFDGIRVILRRSPRLGLEL
jgi:hypothetical protein